MASPRAAALLPTALWHWSLLLWAAKAAPAPVLRFLHQEQVPVIDVRATPGTQDNVFGFEGGQVVKENGTYWYFAAEMFQFPVDAKMRVAIWHASDIAGPWQRGSTIQASNQSYAQVGFVQQCNQDYCTWKNAVPDRFRMTIEYACNPEDLLGSPWAPSPVFDAAEDRWHVLYVSYMCDGTWMVSAGGGNIFGARSTVPGRAGIAGPYETYGIVIGPNATEPAKRWGNISHLSPMYIDQVVTPYQLPNGSLAMFIGEDHYLAMAEAPAGPWRVVSHKGEAITTPTSKFNENPVVSTLRRGDGSTVQVAVFDTVYTEDKGFGMTWSDDGITWHDGVDVALPGGCRTPLGLVDEGDGTASLLFTRRWADCDNQTALPPNGANAISPASCANVHAATFSVGWGAAVPGVQRAAAARRVAEGREGRLRQRLAELEAERAEVLRVLAEVAQAPSGPAAVAQFV